MRLVFEDAESTEKYYNAKWGQIVEPKMFILYWDLMFWKTKPKQIRAWNYNWTLVYFINLGKSQACLQKSISEYAHMVPYIW